MPTNNLTASNFDAPSPLLPSHVAKLTPTDPNRILKSLQDTLGKGLYIGAQTVTLGRPTLSIN